MARTARAIEFFNDQRTIEPVRSDPTEGVVCVVHTAVSGYVLYSIEYVDGRPSEEFSYSGSYRIEWLVGEEVDGALRETLADYAHRTWSHWMDHLFSKSTLNHDLTVTVPRSCAMRWQRQVATEYADLPEHERASDRTEADRILELSKGNI